METFQEMGEVSRWRRQDVPRPRVGRKVMCFRNRRVSVSGHTQLYSSSEGGWQAAV